MMIDIVTSAWRAASAGVRADRSALRGEGRRLLRIEIAADDREAALQEVRRHGQAHPAEPDEADRRHRNSRIVADLALLQAGSRRSGEVAALSPRSGAAAAMTIRAQ